MLPGVCPENFGGTGVAAQKFPLGAEGLGNNLSPHMGSIMVCYGPNGV